MDRHTRDAAKRALAAGTAAIVVEVEQAQGSAPRGVGTRMLVTLGEACGTVGGGHLELKALQTAHAMLAASATAPRSDHYPLGPALGQCCGGAVTLTYAPLTA